MRDESDGGDHGSGSAQAMCIPNQGAFVGPHAMLQLCQMLPVFTSPRSTFRHNQLFYIVLFHIF